MHKVYLCLGSNIDPQENLLKAFRLLRGRVEVLDFSRVWETEAIGSSGPKFLNQVALISTELSIAAIKNEICAQIENELGRKRGEDKNAPRTIDLDILIHDREVLEPDLWEEAYIAQPLAELLPDLLHHEQGKKLAAIAAELGKNTENHPLVDFSRLFQ